MELLDNGIRTDNGNFKYIWYKLKDRSGQTYFRVASIKELYVITDDPTLTRNNEGMLGKQWGSVRGLYNAGVNFIYTACGIYKPDHIGIVQYYGAAADGDSEEQAANKALNDSRAVEASLAGYAQSKLRPPDMDSLRWYINFVLNAKNPLAVIGHPDPRVKRHAAGRDGGMPEEDNDLSFEQNEILFRGMAKLRINFIFQVLSENVPKSLISQYMTQVSRITSNFASRKQGSKNVSFSMGLPIFNALNQSYSSQASQSNSKSLGQGEGFSSGWGNSHTNSVSHTDSVSDTVGESHSQTIGGSTGHNYGTTHSTGDAHSNGTAHTVTDGTSHSESNSQSSSSSSGTSSGWNVLFWSGGSNESSSSSSGHTSTDGTSHSVSNTTSESDTHSTGVANSVGTSVGNMWASTDGVFSSHSVGRADSKGFADGVSQNWGQNHSTSEAIAQSSGMGGGASVGGGGDVWPVSFCKHWTDLANRRCISHEINRNYA